MAASVGAIVLRQKPLQFFNNKLQLETTWEFPQFQGLTLKSRRQKPLQFFNNKLQLETTWEFPQFQGP
ncbi:hypothetical protein [Leptospira sp. severe_002]|uniref:hypothetical protein n=1 Tax=Leptospira sp. severe_002 TaxID=2838237 RepID=UPI0035A366C4